MEYFEESALGPLCPIPQPWWKSYADDVICIVKEDQMDTLFNHIIKMDAHTKFIMESQDSKGSIPFLNTKCTPTLITPFTLQLQKPTHTDRYLDFDSNHPRSAKISVIQALTHRDKMVCSTQELLAKRRLPHRVL